MKIEQIKDIDYQTFRSHVETTLNQMLDRRKRRKHPAPGMKYKKDWHDRMEPLGILNTDGIVNEIFLISEKKSTLPVKDRYVIQEIYKVAIQKSLEE